ncbi:A-kinase anchor protein 14 [Fukomys damarensis]|uniref:A-kinase anchor protein 14 n=1 Tax=Fukomys damarensis TaxID=885580 RepID=UPI00054011B1|nr:A-kinase anchor protein 14 [Fukomys damarensis]
MPSSFQKTEETIIFGPVSDHLIKFTNKYAILIMTPKKYNHKGNRKKLKKTLEALNITAPKKAEEFSKCISFFAFVNILCGNLGERLLRDPRLRQLPPLVFETRISSLRPKKMDETKKSKGRRVVIIENSPSKVTTKDMEDNTNGTDTENSETMTAVGLTVAEDVTHIAAQSVGETKHCTRKIQWVTHGEFTAERGRRQIQELISTCKYRIGWACSTEFMKKEDVIHSFHYIYRVSWSLSTAELPVASVYAIAYFTIKIRKNKPWDAPIDISYVFEDQTLVQRPEWICFQEGILMNIIEAKHVLINSIKAYLSACSLQETL